MEVFFCAALCNAWIIHHNRLRRDANEHTVYAVTENDETSVLLKRVHKILKEHCYRPPLYCSFDMYGQLQTTVQFFMRNIGAVYLTSTGRITYRRELLSVQDGEVIALDWVVTNQKNGRKREDISGNVDSTNSSERTFRIEENSTVPTIILHHGLCGDSSSEHIVFMVRKFLSCYRDYRIVVVVARGCGGTELLTTDTMHGARTSDLRAAIKHIHSKSPKSRLFGMGFSLGACVMLKYLGEEGKGTELESAFCVSPPWDGREQTPMYQLWSVVLALPVKLYALRHRNRLKPTLNLASILTASTLSEVDAMLAGSYGFGGRDDYYAACSPLPFSSRISIPTIALSARDDPVCSHTTAPLPSLPVTLSLTLPSSPSSFSSSSSVPTSFSENNTHNKTNSSSSNNNSSSNRNNDNHQYNIETSPPSSPLPSSSSSSCRLIIIKTLLGGHLAFPSSSSTPSPSVSLSFSIPPYLSFPLSSLCDAWCDDIAVDWIESFFVEK